MPSPHSIPQSPHSIKSSPSSDIKSSDPHTNALLDAGLQSQIVLSPRNEKESLKQVENPANHFPINLTPTPTLQNSGESGNNSPSSSIYGSPRSKRKRRTESIDSDRSGGGASITGRPNQQSVITATTATVQSTTSSTHRHQKNTSNQSRVPPPQHLTMVPQPTVLIPNTSVITNRLGSSQPGINGHPMGHSTVLRPPMKSEPDMPSEGPIMEQQHPHLYGGLTHGFLQNPSVTTFSNATEISKDLKDKRMSTSQSPVQISAANGIPIESSVMHNAIRIPAGMALSGVPFYSGVLPALGPYHGPAYQLQSPFAQGIAFPTISSRAAHPTVITQQQPHLKKTDK